MKRPVLLPLTLALALAAAAAAQTPTPTPTRTPTPTPTRTSTPTGPTPTPALPTTVATGTTYTTQDAGRVSGVRVQVDAEGGVWFLQAAQDRLGVLRGTTITYWQLRPNDDIGANPVDFRLDGTDVWILETGQSLIPAGTCALAKLDTVTGALMEWVIPGSIPGDWYQAPDGKYWFPMSGGTLQSVDLTTNQVVNHRSQRTRAYSDMAVGPDGALWLVDFGNNRIVRYEPDAATETSWAFFDTSALLNPTEIRFDPQGRLWIAQLSAGRIDRFDPATNVLYSYYGITNPIHFEFYQGRIYVASGQTNPAINVLDETFALSVATALIPQTLDVGAVPSAFPVTTRTSTAIQSTFESTAEAMPADQITVAGNASFPGVLVTQFPPTHAYGITISDGTIWTGQDGKIANINLQTVGGPSDLAVPVANSAVGEPNDRIRIDMTLSNVGTTAIAGEGLFLYSPAAFAARMVFALPPGATQFFPDAFGPIGARAAPATGPIRIRMATGSAADSLAASVRSTRVRPDNSAYGYALVPEPAAQSLGPGSETTLFTGARATETSVLGLYSLGGATGVLELVAADGTVRGLRPFTFVTNTHEEYNPAASAFSVAPEPGDVVRVSVQTGDLQAYVNVLDLGTIDVATSIPIVAGPDFVIPIAGTLASSGDRSYASDLYLSNPSTDTPANVTITYIPLGDAASSQTQTVTLAAGASQTIADFLPTLFGIAAGQGGVHLTSTVPIAAGVRIASRWTFGDYAGFAAGIPGAAGIQNGSAFAIGVPQTGSRWTNLLLYNGGTAGSLTITGFRGDGSQVGPLTFPLGGGEAARLDSVFAALGVTNQAAGRIRVDVPAGMILYAWTAEVDYLTGDVDIFPLR